MDLYSLQPSGTMHAVGTVYTCLLRVLQSKRTLIEFEMVRPYLVFQSDFNNLTKTDPFRRGQTVNVFANHLSTCPVRAMTCYRNLVRHTDAADQVFKVGRFQPLAPNTLNEVLRYLLQQGDINQANYASHSFRIGAATTAAAVGIPAWLIKTLGRWSSNAYMTYIRCPSTVLSAVPRISSNTDATHQPSWDPDSDHLQ